MALAKDWLEYQLEKAAKGYCPLTFTEYKKFIQQHQNH